MNAITASSEGDDTEIFSLVHAMHRRFKHLYDTYVSHRIFLSHREETQQIICQYEYKY